MDEGSLIYFAQKSAGMTHCRGIYKINKGDKDALKKKKMEKQFNRLEKQK